MKKFYFLKALCLILIISGCSKEKKNYQTSYSFTFEDGNQGWQSFFSDYPVGAETFYELEFANTSLPSPLDQSIKSLKISGNNHSDDLLSAVVRKFENLKPNRSYAITFDIDLASNALIGGAGAGGDPNLSIGVGGVNYLPKNTIDNLNHYRPNFISKIQSGQSNEVFKVIGKIGSSTTLPASFKIINRNNSGDPITVTTNSNGEFWLMIATDSGYEGITTLYYKSIHIEME